MRKGTYSYLAIAALVIAALGFFMVSEPMADEGQPQQENKALQFFKNLINWPFGITKKSSEAVGRTAKSATMTVTTTGSSAVETVTGKPEKIKDVVVTPVKGSGETAYTAVTENVKAPVEGTKESFEGNK